jgi:hypothetical protein
METLDSIAPGGGAKDASLTLWNSTSKLWRGNAVLLTGEEAKKARIDLSGGWTWLPDASWVTLRPAAIEVGPNASASIVATVAVPAGEGRHGKAWEAILMVRGGEGGVAFARLRIKTLEQATR